VRQAGLLDTTLLVVTADHGEGTGEHGLWGHGWSVYEEEVRVPLVMRLPALLPAGARIAEPAEHVDVVPTLLEALGRPPLPGLDGVSLLGAVRGAPALAPGVALSELTLGYPAMALRLGPHRLMVVDDTLAPPQPAPPPGQTWLPRAVARPGTRLFDVVADPGETRPLEAERPLARRLLEIHLGEALAVPAKARRAAGLAGAARFTADKAVIDPRLKRELEALGYVAE
jgi:arylsulfatase A-like enzyme